MKPVLLAGETFHSISLVARGYDVGTAGGSSNGATAFIAALDRHGVAVEQIGGESCEQAFPRSLEGFDRYSAVVISDVGALSLLITPETRRGVPGPNRLETLRQWVEAGGGLLMAGGYTGFQGMDGMARFHETAVEDCLPVTCLPHSDGLEAPEGLVATVLKTDHPIVAGIPPNWPPVLGLNKVVPRPDSEVEIIADCSYRARRLPLLATRRYGRGRTIAWTTDIGPHWLSAAFLKWSGYASLMTNMVNWLAASD